MKPLNDMEGECHIVLHLLLRWRRIPLAIAFDALKRVAAGTGTVIHADIPEGARLVAVRGDNEQFRPLVIAMVDFGNPLRVGAFAVIVLVCDGLYDGLHDVLVFAGMLL